jgi:hypothetical protein
VDILLLVRLKYCSGIFYFLVFFLFVWLYASVLPFRYCVVAEARCNWYLSILLYYLYRKKNYPWEHKGKLKKLIQNIYHVTKLDPWCRPHFHNPLTPYIKSLIRGKVHIIFGMECSNASQTINLTGIHLSSLEKSSNVLESYTYFLISTQNLCSWVFFQDL